VIRRKARHSAAENESFALLHTLIDKSFAGSRKMPTAPAIAVGDPVKPWGHVGVPLLLQRGSDDTKALAHRAFLSFH